MHDDRLVPRDAVTEILQQRGSVYGLFTHNAETTNRIREAMRHSPSRWDLLPDDVKLGLDLIALKIARIVTGDHSHLDNYDDIAGYAKIVADRIRNERV